MSSNILRMSHLRRAGWLLLLDVAIVAAASLLALLIRFDTLDFSEAVFRFMPGILLPVLLRPATFLVFGLYRREWRYASVQDLRDLAVAVVAGSAQIVMSFIVFLLLGGYGTVPFPRSFFLIEPLLTFVGIAGVRFVIRNRLERQRLAGIDDAQPGTPTLVYGAGEAGALVGRLAAAHELPGIRIVGYVDDDPQKRGSRLLGHRVYGPLEELESIVRRSGATQMVVAIPFGPAQPIRRALAASQGLGLALKTVPPLRDLVTGGFQFSGVRGVELQDLLRRPPVKLDNQMIAKGINGASVVVTGGGGSIGGELVRQIMRLGPRQLTIVDHHEWALWNIERDLARQLDPGESGRVTVALADVRSPSAMENILRRARPDVVFHAAAHKHVPYVESYPSEGIRTNVSGTKTVLRICEQLGVPRFVLISTDKAVDSVSVMGAAKRLAEQLTVMAGRRTGRGYAAVRFGNVLGSSGSVVPLLQRQLDDGLPLTITQPDATRYFMTISEAVSLILEAGADPHPGEVYVLDMGDPVRVIDLAHDLVRLNGLDPKSVAFTVTGMRPGERVHERLFHDGEGPERTEHAGILRATATLDPDDEAAVDALVDELERAARDNDDQAIRQLLRSGHYLHVEAVGAATGG